MKRVFSGVQPSGLVHIGNYLGAIKQWVQLQEEYETIYSVVDLHAITLPQEPQELSKNVYRMVATYLACGVNPEKSTIFIQSHRPEHTELAWIVSTLATFGEMQRMTQFKDKASKFAKSSVPLGIFTYPTLMVADILLYQANFVPVGDDQKQHVELARNIAQRFNSKFGNAFVVPEPILPKAGKRVMALDNPRHKMSKSATSALGYISLTDSAEEIRNKISKAVTDSGAEIEKNESKLAISNLIDIYALFADVSTSDIEKRYIGKTYAVFKKDLADILVEKVVPIGKKIHEIEQDKTTMRKILKKGADKLMPLAQQTMRDVRKKMGLA